MREIVIKMQDESLKSDGKLYLSTDVSDLTQSAVHRVAAAQRSAIDKKNATANTTTSSWTSLQVRPVYTVDDALQKLGFGAFQVILTALIAVILFADAMEMMLLSTLCFLVRCEWGLSSTEEAVITSMVFCGAILGSTFWGVFGDRFGRKKAIFGMECIMIIFGVLSALKLTPNDDRIPGYPWILFCRFGVGLGTSCQPQLSTYYIEFLPKRVRAICSVLMYVWWSLGAVFGAGLAAGLMGETNLGWHWFVGLTASPLLLAIAGIPFFPESARYLVVKGRREKARRVLQTVAWFNCRELPEGEVVSHEEKYGTGEESGAKAGKRQEKEEEVVHHVETVRRVMSINQPDYDDDLDERRPLLVHRKNPKVPAVVATANSRPSVQEPCHKLSLFFRGGKWKITVLLIPIWIFAAIFYYGVIILTSTMFEFDPHCGVGLNGTTAATSHQHGGSGANLPGNNNGTSPCHEDDLDLQDYLNLMWTAAAELPGLFVTVLIIEILGRKVTMAINFVVIAGGFGLLFLCPKEEILTFILFFVRAFCAGVTQVIYVYTSEVYPTSIRGLASGILNSFSRVGAIATPYLAQVLFQASDYATLASYSAMGVVIAILALLLPLETKGKTLKDER